MQIYLSCKEIKFTYLKLWIMKTKLLFLALLSTITIYAQTQIGSDIDGEAVDDHSGWSVSISSDGSVVAIGAPSNDGNGRSSGHVRVYQNNSGIWTQIGSDIDGEAQDDVSGCSVSISSDGSILAIGAYLNDGTANASGHVRVYQNLAGVWTQIGDDIDGESQANHSGYSVSLSSDGSVVAIGANISGYASGQVRVFQNHSGVWTQVGADIDGEASPDNSGWSVSLSSDGSVVAIGAIYNDGNGSNSGHVRVYQNLSGVWTQIGDDIDGEAAEDRSGFSVSLSSDGSVVAIGAPYNSGNGTLSGHVRVYQNLSGVWTQIGEDIDGETAFDESGSSVSLSSDGSTVAIGAPYNYENGTGPNSGHVRVYDLSALLSLADNQISKNFAIYPNPVNNYLQLQLATTLEYKKATIYNYFGQLILQSKTTTINVSDLASGVYFLEVETNTGKGVKKFIKK